MKEVEERYAFLRWRQEILKEVDVAEFLGEIFYDTQDDEVVCLGRKKPRAGVLHCTPGDRAARNVLAGTDALPAYFNTCTVKPRNEDGWLSRKAVDVMRCYCVVLDDIGTKSEHPLVTSSWVIESSPGNEQWGYIIDPTTEFEKVTGFLRWCAEKGYTDAGAANSHSRLFRVPGSVHASKVGEDGKPFRSLLRHWEPEVWSIDELIKAFGAKEADFPKVARRRDPQALVQTLANGRKDESLAYAAAAEDELLLWLNDNGYLMEDDNGHEWLNIRCPWAAHHSGGDGSAGYSPLGRGGNAFFRSGRAFHCLHEHSRAPEDQKGPRTWDHFIDWAVSQGAPVVAQQDPIGLLCNRYVYIEQEEKYLDLWNLRSKDNLVSPAAFRVRHPGNVSVPWRDKPIGLASAFAEDERVRKAASFRYDPRTDDVYISDGGQVYVNTFHRPTSKSDASGPALFLEHTHYLIPDDTEREEFLDWLAFKFQHPSKRGYGVLMVTNGAQGLGRSLLGKMIAAAWPGATANVPLPTLLGKNSATNTYNDWGVGKLFVVVEETADTPDQRDHWKGYEHFKTLIDSSPVPMRINPKYGRTREEHLWFNLLMFSNHTDALVIPETDRRLMVIRNPDEAKPLDYFTPLYEALDGDEPAKIYAWLMARQVHPDFNPKLAPMTAGKAQLLTTVATAQDDVQAIARGIIQEHHIIYLCKAWLRNIVACAVRHIEGNHGAFTHAQEQDVHFATQRIWRSLTKGGFGPNGVRVTLDGNKTPFRSCENDQKHTASVIAEWINEAEITQHMDSETALFRHLYTS